GQACPFILLVLSGRLDDLQAALLTSLMDVIGLRYGQGDLSNSLSWPDGLNRLHCHPRGEHLLSLLGQNMKDTGQDTAKQENTSGTSSWLREPTVRRPLRSHSRQQSSPRRLIQYPPPPSKGGITVTTEDLECLKDGGFLNDVIIDFYVKYLLLERVVKDVAERSHIFRSFFYKQLTRKYTSCPEETSRIAPYRRHQRVRTWTRHVDIFSKDYLFIPVNQEPCILVTDSLKLSYHQRIYTLLREYLQLEWEVRKGTAQAFTRESISGSLCRVPLQDNSSDCGLYLLQYVESFLQVPTYIGLVNRDEFFAVNSKFRVCCSVGFSVMQEIWISGTQVTPVCFAAFS
ncbi:hypothetical protein cypCar_00027783, partial [Cyprinus carpio]